MKNPNAAAPGMALLMLVCGIAVSPVMAQTLVPAALESPTVARDPAQLEELDEVVVQGTRLADRIAALEERFFRLYNTLNTKDDFDVHCAHVDSAIIRNDSAADPASRIQQRVCNVAFFIDALAQQMRHESMCQRRNDEFDQDDLVPPICYESPPAELVLMARADEYRRNLLQVVNSDARLQEMVQEREALEREGQLLTTRYAEIAARDQAGDGSQRRRVPPRVR